VVRREEDRYAGPRPSRDAGGRRRPRSDLDRHLRRDRRPLHREVDRRRRPRAGAPRRAGGGRGSRRLRTDRVIGEPTKEVIEILQSTRLFLDAAEVAKDVDRLRALLRVHEYPKRKADWWSTWTGKDRNTPEYKKDRAAFLAHFKELHDEYNSLLGRLRQAEAVARQIDERSDKIDEHGHLEIKTAYYKTRNRRFQPCHLWPTELSSKEDAEQAVVPDENVLFGDTENDETDFPTEQDAIDFAKLVVDDPRVVRVGNTIIVK
jgi:hypothetical protein